MHEYSIVSALLDRVEAEARRRHATAVHAITVKLGALAGVDVGLFKTAFDTFRAGTICAETALTVEDVAARWICPACRRAVTPGALLRCTNCDEPARLDGGDEILLERIEMEVP